MIDEKVNQVINVLDGLTLYLAIEVLRKTIETLKHMRLDEIIERRH